MQFNAMQFLEGLYSMSAARVAELSLVPDDLPPDWRYEYEERAGIRHFEGGLPLERAEALAFKEIIERMEKAGVDVGALYRHRSLRGRDRA